MPDRVVWLPMNSAGLGGAPDSWGDRGRRGVDRAGGTMTDLSASATTRGGWSSARRSAIFVFLMLTVLVAILIERKVLGRMQMRFGPNRVGPFGLLQSLVDGVKLGLKEGLIPPGVDKPVYLLAPVISVIPAFMAFAVIPMGPRGVGVRPPHPAAADRPAGGGALHPGRHLDRRVRHRAGRLGVRLDLSAARRAALVPPR